MLVVFNLLIEVWDSSAKATARRGLDIVYRSNFLPRCCCYRFGLVCFFTSQSIAMLMSGRSVHLTTLSSGQA